MRYCLLLMALLSLLVGNAQLRLASRFIYVNSDGQCSYKTKNNWRSKVAYNNGYTNAATNITGEYLQYQIATDGLSGTVAINIFKNTSTTLLDTSVKVLVWHNGQLDSLTTNFATKRDGWYTIGQFACSGSGNEYVRFVRTTTNRLLFTQALPIRLDIYYDTHTRNQTVTEQTDAVPIGFSAVGNWRQSDSVGYRTLVAKPLESNVVGAKISWNPGQLDSGVQQLYVFKPNVSVADAYEIFHNNKVDIVYLKDLKYANLDVKNPANDYSMNPVIAQGWYQLGEFDFSGTGNEYVRLTKTTTDTTFADCIIFEKIEFDGTILHRTVVTPNQYVSGLYSGKFPTTLAQKEQITQLPVGFSPQISDASQFYGSTIYSRALWLRNTAIPYYWNPIISEPGDYELLYYSYYKPSKNGYFTIKSNGTSQKITVSNANMPTGSFVSIGTFTFNGGKADEYIQMNGIDRASDIVLEKKTINSAILKQVLVTEHPYYRNYNYSDTKNHVAAHEISFMVSKGFAYPTSTTTFAPNAGCSRAVFVQSLVKMLGIAPNTTLPGFADVAPTDSLFGYIAAAKKYGLLYGLPDTAKFFPNNTIYRNVAAQLLLNAMEYLGRYTNVKNLYKTKPAVVLAKFADAATVRGFAAEAVARMIEMRVLLPDSLNRLQPLQPLTRANAMVLLKEFYESVAQSGPAHRLTDWELTFNDEFDGDMLDYSKWGFEDYVRFAGVSAKWKENCVVEDGVFKGYNFQDNHKVPYSSGNIVSKFKQTYGFFEARYKYPDKAYGSHSSFWTSSRGGDNNYNEGTYPNGISNNNYFMRDPERANNFIVPYNLAHDFHTISGYQNNTDLFYGFDGKISYNVPNYPQFYADSTKTTNVPYGVWMSTVITPFDGPLDRDRIDGSFMACDWVRVYKETTWLPEVETDLCLPATSAVNQPVVLAPVIKFTKAMDAATITPASVLVAKVGGGAVPTYTLEQATPLRFRIRFSGNLDSNAQYTITILSGVKDVIGNTLLTDTTIRFSTVGTALPATDLRIIQSGVRSGSIWVQWHTLTETNTAFFEVQRSANGGAFTTIGKQLASGTTNNQRVYAFTDNHPLAQHNYYRIQQLNTNGVVESVSNTAHVLLTNLNAQVAVKYLPQPYALANWPIPEKITLRLYDALGRLVHYQQVALTTGNNRLMFPPLTKGLYYLQVIGAQLQAKTSFFTY